MPARRQPADDPYAVLGLTPGADLAAVRAARRNLLRQVHPDTAGDVPDAAERAQAINQAYAAIGARVARATELAERAAAIPPVEIAPAYAWVESPYPMPPQRRGGATLGMILLCVTLPAAAMMLPGVPGPVASLLPAEGAGAAAFARASLHQVRRLITPAGFAAPAAATPASPALPPPPPPPPVAGVAPQDIARAVAQRDRIAGAEGPDGVVAFSRNCVARSGPATPAILDFCAAFDAAADRLDEAAARAAYARIGADPARLDAVKALVE